MRSHIRLSVALVVAAACGACSSITVEKPVKGSTVAKPPLDIHVTSKTWNFVTLGDVFLDSFNMSLVNGSHMQYVPSATRGIIYVSPGSHTLTVSARDKFHLNVSDASTFTVTKSPLHYTCPTGQQVHPALGQCCDSVGNCDTLAFANFGPNFYDHQDCDSKPLFPGSTLVLSDVDCISSSADVITGTGSALMSAVRVTPAQTGALAQIQVPVDWESGTNGIQVWITTDAGGKPGTALETITQNNLRPHPTPPPGQFAAPPVDSPVHIFSTTHPQLTAGTNYWLVIGPIDATTRVWWNKAFLLNDASIPATTTYLVNTTPGTGLTGPWAAKSNLRELRPAFEIDVR